MVSSRKCAMSDLSRHGSVLLRPMTPFSATAATITMSIIIGLGRAEARSFGAQNKVSQPFLIMPGTRVAPLAGPSVNLVPGIHDFGFGGRVRSACRKGHPIRDL